MFLGILKIFVEIEIVLECFMGMSQCCQVERLKLPKKLVSFMESREEILVMPLEEEAKEEEKGFKVASWGFKVEQAGESNHPWSDRPLNLRLNSFVENFKDEEQGLKVVVTFDTYVQDGRIETCGRSEYF